MTPGAASEDAREGFARLMANYADYATRAQALPRERYARERWLDQIVGLYGEAASARGREA